MLISIYFPLGRRPFRRRGLSPQNGALSSGTGKILAHVPLDPGLRYAMGVRTVVIERKVRDESQGQLGGRHEVCGRERCV